MMTMTFNWYAQPAAGTGLESQIRTHLLAAAAVVSLVSDRIWWLRQPQMQALPSITFLLAAAAYEAGHGNQAVRTGLASTYQFDCWAGDISQARALARAVVNAMRQFPGSTGIRLEMDHYRPEPTNIHRAIVEVDILYTQE